MERREDGRVLKRKRKTTQEPEFRNVSARTVEDMQHCVTAQWEARVSSVTSSCGINFFFSVENCYLVSEAIN